MPCIKGCLISKACAEAYSGTKQPPCATELVVPSQHADNNARDEIPTFEILWQRMSKDQPACGNVYDALSAQSVKIGAALMYDALVKIKVGTSPVA